MADDEAIELTLPADTRLVRLARLVASGVAAAVNFDVDEVDDLRIAVDEMCTALIEGGDGTPLRLRFVVGDDDVCVRGESGLGEGALSMESDRLSLSKQILGVVVNEHELIVGDDAISFRLRKVRQRGGEL
ncbi:MAG: ATP-binding protein [Acidimicrobiia bacterium]